MNKLLFLRYFLPILVAGSAHAQNLTTQTPLTMEQLMRELRIQGGNFVFTFDRPVFAHITAAVSQYPDGKQTTTEEFVSDQANHRIELFFSASALFVGDYARADQAGQLRKMLIKLSDCKATRGARIVHYVDKFVENKHSEGRQGLYSPSLPLNPGLNEEYILHYYYKEGDPFEAKVTICFLEKPEDFSKVKKFDRNESRTWKSADEKK